VRDLYLDQDEDIQCGQVARTPVATPTHARAPSSSGESCTCSGVVRGPDGERRLISPRSSINTPTSSLASDLKRRRISWSAPPALIKHADWTQPPRQFPADCLDHQVVKAYIKTLEVSIFKKMDSLFFQQNY